MNGDREGETAGNIKGRHNGVLEAKMFLNEKVRDRARRIKREEGSAGVP